MLKALIVDDEPLAREILEGYIEKIPEINLISSCDNAIAANEILQSNEIDLVFLDIQMPQMTGIQLMRTLQNPPKVVFTTAYAEYAVDGFELDAVDYLLKPISFERFMKAINKVKSLSGGQSSSPEADEGDYFFVKADKKLVKINYDDILYIEGLKDYVIIKKEVGRVIALQTMKSLESKLPSNRFKRIHRSYIVNTKRINALVGNSIELTEADKVKHIPIGKNYKEDLLAIVANKKL